MSQSVMHLQDKSGASVELSFHSNAGPDLCLLKRGVNALGVTDDGKLLLKDDVRSNKLLNLTGSISVK